MHSFLYKYVKADVYQAKMLNNFKFASLK